MQDGKLYMINTQEKFSKHIFLQNDGIYLSSNRIPFKVNNHVTLHFDFKNIISKFRGIKSYQANKYTFSLDKRCLFIVIETIKTLNLKSTFLAPTYLFATRYTSLICKVVPSFFKTQVSVNQNLIVKTLTVEIRRR